MTESEWLACDEPDLILDFLRGKISREQLVDFVRRCWERIAAFLPPVPHDHTVVEEFAELAPGQSDHDALTYACEAALKAATWAPNLGEERKQQAALLRQLVGNPFRQSRP